MNLILESNVYRLWTTLLSVYDDSATHRMLAALGRGCNSLIDGSAILRVLCREGEVAHAWKSSRAYGVLSFLVNLPGWLLHHLYAALRPVFDGSFFVGLAFEIGNETAITQSWLVMLLWAIPYKYWNNAFTLAGFCLLLLIFYLRSMRDGSAKLDVGNIGFYPVLFFAAVCLALPLSAYPSLSGRFLLYHVSAALCVLVTVSAVRGAEDLKRLAAGGSFCVLVSSLYGVYQRVQGVTVNKSYVDVTVNAGMPGRVESYFDNPNTFAEVLILLLPIVIALILCSRHTLSRLAAAVVCAVGIVALGMTYSRASWVGIACAAVVFVFLWKPRLIPLFAMACVVVIPLLPSTILHRILTITNTNDTSTTSRIPLYQAALAVIKASPVTGAGLGTAAVQRFITDHNLYHAKAPFVHAHNFYLQVWVESGLLGVVSFVGAILWSIKRAAHTVRYSKPSAARTITCAGASALAGSMVCGLADYLWNYPRVMSIFWFVFALTIAGIRVCRAEGIQE